MKYLIISLFPFLFCLVIQSLRMKDASDSGINFSLRYNSILVGQLRDRDGNFKLSEIDISRDISNIDGNLTYGRGGGFDKTCRNCSINQRLILSCTCQRAIRGFKQTTLRTGAFIQNNDRNFEIRRK